MNWKKFGPGLLVIGISLTGLLALSQEGLRTAKLPGFKTREGKPVPNCKITYIALGRLDATKSNAILFPTWFGGKSANLKEFAITLIDTSKFFVILADALGNGLSSSPSNTRNFPGISIHDMVVAEHQLLTSELKINHLFAVVGISMGGMQTFEWLASYPDFVDRAVPIVGTPKQSGQDALLWETEWNIIEQAGPNPDARRKALVQVSSLHSLNLYTPAYWAREKKAEEVASKIKKDGDTMQKNTNPENWICQIKAMLGQDIYASSGKSPADFQSILKAKVLVVVALQDHMVNPNSAIEFSKNCHTEFLELEGDCGHLATVCEMDKMGPVVKSFLFSDNSR